MNQLYGLLTSKLESVEGWYSKLHTPVTHTPKSAALCALLTANVPDAKLPLFACVVCKLATQSMFKSDILALDGENTYETVVRDPSAPSGSADDTVGDMTCTAQAAKAMYKYLDKDILDRLVVPTWPEVASAVCLQLLRETT
jgi:hypothetical protein